jgi:serine/threonine-protein kinase HipA
MSWLKENAPEAVRAFFQTGYPDMRSVQENINVAENAGYNLLSTHTLPRDSWIDGYYDVLLLRARSLLDHPDSAVRQFAADTVREIEVFDLSEDSYGYVFYALQRP